MATTSSTTLTEQKLPSVEAFVKAHLRLKGIAAHTPLMHNLNLSEHYNANIYLKREDLQVVRSYKIRGAYNMISSLNPEELERGVVCASAGNHAQGVAYACRKMGLNGVIFMPNPTPSQKINQVKMFGKGHIEIVLTGDTFDDSYKEAIAHAEEFGKVIIPPFDHHKIIEGQGTVGIEIMEDTEVEIDYLLIPIGGGGLSAGVGSYVKQISPKTKIIGIEPEGAPAMKRALDVGKVVTLEHIDKFVDGAAVQRVGETNFQIIRQIIDDVVLVPEGKVCSTILKLYNEEAIVVEPAGALSIAALDFYKEEIKGKNVVCIVSGSNNDITRMEEIKERSLLYEGLKHYFIVRFPQRAGALREFVSDVLGPDDDITHFEYTKKVNRERGPALVGIELKEAKDFKRLIKNMDALNISYERLNERFDIFNFLV